MQSRENMQRLGYLAVNAEEEIGELEKVLMEMRVVSTLVHISAARTVSLFAQQRIATDRFARDRGFHLVLCGVQACGFSRFTSSARGS